MKFIYNVPAIINDRFLVITDIHVGSKLSPDWRIIYESINELMSEHKLKKLMILGDIKENIISWKGQPIKLIKELGERYEVHVVKGNHDGNIEKFKDLIEIHPPQGVIINKTGYIHGHARPKEEIWNVRKVLMGHVHPMYKGEKVFIRVKTSRSNEFIILPSYTGISGSREYFNKIPKEIKETFIKKTVQIYLLNGIMINGGS